LPEKQSATDLLPTHFLTDNVDVLAPFVMQLLNRCLSACRVSSSFKAAYIMPLLKKSNLDLADPKSY